MIRKSISFLLLIAIIATGCSHRLTPKEVVDSFIQKMRTKDFEGAKKLVTEKTQVFVQAFADLYARDKPDESEPPEPRTFETSKATITGNEATVPVEYKKGGKTILSFPMYLEKEKGQWKVVLASPEDD